MPKACTVILEEWGLVGTGIPLIGRPYLVPVDNAGSSDGRYTGLATELEFIVFPKHHMRPNSVSWPLLDA